MIWTLRGDAMVPGLKAILENPEHALQHRGEILKSTSAVTVWRDGPFVLKRWAPRTVPALVKDIFRKSYAHRAFSKACRLQLSGISTAGPLAAGDRRTCGILRSSYYLMEGIRAASHLAEHRERNNRAVHEVARLLGRLHDTGFTHRDLKPTNLLFDPEGRAYLIDLEGLRTMQEVSDTQAVGDLSKLARRMIELATLRPVDAAAFLQEYRRVRGKGNRVWWWREIRARIAPYFVTS
jgi:hypothetical protein